MVFNIMSKKLDVLGTIVINIIKTFIGNVVKYPGHGNKRKSEPRLREMYVRLSVAANCSSNRIMIQKILSKSTKNAWGETAVAVMSPGLNPISMCPSELREQFKKSRPDYLLRSVRASSR